MVPHLVACLVSSRQPRAKGAHFRVGHQLECKGKMGHRMTPTKPYTCDWVAQMHWKLP